MPSADGMRRAGPCALRGDGTSGAARRFRFGLTVPVAAALIALSIQGVPAQSPRTHRLEATPDTVAYGYYWADATPVLRIRSGDIIDVDTLLTNTPSGLERAGVPNDKIQPSLKAM